MNVMVTNNVDTAMTFVASMTHNFRHSPEERRLRNALHEILVPGGLLTICLDEETGPDWGSADERAWASNASEDHRAQRSWNAESQDQDSQCSPEYARTHDWLMRLEDDDGAHNNDTPRTGVLPTTEDNTVWVTSCVEGMMMDVDDSESLVPARDYLADV